MRIKDLQAQKAKLVSEMRSLADSPADNGDLSAEQEKRFTGIKSEVENIEKRIERQTYLDELERQAETVDSHPEFDREKRSYSLLKAIAYKAGMDVDAGREREISAELAKRHGRQPGGIFAPTDVFHMEQRVLTTAAPGAGPGSNITPVDYRPGEFIDILRAKLVTRRLGARILSGLTGSVDIGKLKVSATAAWVAENGAISASDPQFDQLQMTPKHCGALVEFSRNMLQQSSPDIENILRMDFAGLLARAIDKVAIEGGGANEPTGILETAGINTVAKSTGWTWASILDFISQVEIDDSTGNGWVTTPAEVKTLRSTVKETAVYLADPGTAEPVSADYIMEGPNSLAGYPLISTTLCLANQIIFGNWNDLLIGYWSALDILVNPYESTAYTKGNVQVRGMLTADVGVRHPVSFCAANLG